MASSRTFIVALVSLQSLEFSTSNSDVFKKLIPEFTFCFDFVNLRNDEELVNILMNFPLHVQNRQQKCFLRCLLRRHGVFIEPTGTLWNWQNALEYLMSFGYSSGREPYVKSALYFCIRKKELLLSKYGCKNAFNFFRCLTMNGLSFKENSGFWEIRKQYLKDHPYGQRETFELGPNATFRGPTRKRRGNVTLGELLQDVTQPNVTDDEDFLGFDESSEGCTQFTKAADGNSTEYEDEDEEESTTANNYKDDENDEADDDGDMGDNPLKVTATEPYQRSHKLDKRTTIPVTIPHVASRINRLNLRWVQMVNSD